MTATTKHKHYSKAKRGQRNPHATMTPAKVRTVRREARKDAHAYGWRSALARRYSVTPACIGDILSGRRWSHIT